MTKNRDFNAWAAGFFDGDGCVYLGDNRWKTTHRVMVSIGQRDPKPLKVLKKQFRGSLHSYRSKNGKLYHTWLIACLQAEVFLKAIAPYVINKARVVKLALEARSLVGAIGLPQSGKQKKRLTAIRAQIKKLNRKD